jgi:hypothetical protein
MSRRPSWITPREWRGLKAQADRTGKPVAVRRANPSRRPVKGEIWHGLSGDRCRILSVVGDRVTVLQLDTGHRVTSEMHDFLASYKPPGGRAPNPKRLNFPKVLVDSLKVGDMVMPPEREMRLWMIRDAAEKGMSPSDLGILLTDVHEGEPDKGGRWIFLTGYLRDQWYAGRRQYPMKFKARPNTPWPVAARPAQDNPARSPGARARRKAARSSRRSVGQGIGGRRVLRALSRGQRAKAQHIALQSKYRYRHRHAPVPSSNPATARADRPGNDRDFAAKVIRDNLKKRSGKPWSVTVGRGTAWGWLHLDAPNRRRTWHWRLKSPDMPDYPENYEEYDTGQPGGHMGPIERAELAGLLGLERLDSYQGISIPGASDYYDEYMDRAQGRTPEREGKPYWDNPSRSRRAQYGRASRRAAPRGVPGLGSRRAARAIRSGRAAKAHYHMMSTTDRGRFRPQSNPKRRNPGGPRIVYNKLLGGWYVVIGPHQTPLNGRFNSKAEAQAWLSGRRTPNPKRWNVRYVRTLSPLAQRKALAFEAEQTTQVGAGLKKPAVVARARVLLDAYLRGALQGGQTVSLEEVKSVWLTSLIHAATEVRGRPNRRVSRHKTSARRRVTNPRGRGSEMARARRTSQMWHEFPASHVRRIRGPGRVIPKTLVALGEAVKVDYRSNKYTGRMATYTHSFKRPRPILATDPDAKHLHLVGGKVKITADGLEN